MMTLTLDVAATPAVASGTHKGSGGSQGIIGPPRTADFQQKSPVSLKAKQGPTAQYRLQNFHQQANAIAKSLRSDDQALERIQTFLNQAERPLSNIVKTYPPYPTGSEERVKLLRSFNSYRKMIDKLTVPPVQDQSLSEMGFQPTSSADEIPIHGTVNQAEQDPGLKELDIPGLPKNADNKEIQKVLGRIHDAEASILQKRNQVFEKAAKIKEMLHQGHPYGDSIEQRLGITEDNDDLIVDPEGLSRNIKEGLLSAPAGYMHTDRSQMINLL